MTHRPISPSLSAAVFCAAILVSTLAHASTPQAAPVPRQTPAAPVALQAVPNQPPAALPDDTQDATLTRARLEELLNRCPPALGRVLKLDPSLLSSQAYLAPYPALAGFLANHLEIARDPQYFLADISGGGWPYRPDPREAAVNLWRDMMQMVSIMVVLSIVAAAIVWLIKALIDHRRWLRLSKVQVEVHNKLLDRFSTNEELLAYVQSPAGRRLLESAPAALEATPREIGAGIRRILWAVQAGLVLATAGGGLLFVSGRVVADVREPFFAFGAVIVSIGIGFVLSAIVSYALSRRLGLLEPAKTPGERSSTAPGA